jgi:hypothetical protein
MIRFLLSSAVALFFLFACATDRVATDLAVYLNQGVMNVAELEQKSLERYAAVTGDNYTSDESVYQALKDQVIPLYRRFLEGLRAIRPETDEVRNLNRVIIEAAQAMYEGFRLKMVGIEQDETELILAGNRKIDEGRMKAEAWQGELVGLANRSGLALVAEERKPSWWDIFKPATSN